MDNLPPGTPFANRAQFRKKLRNRELLTGVFVKTPHHAIVEVLCTTELDFIVLDAEHAPFGRNELSACILACFHTNTTCLVRVPECTRTHITQALDMGADGIVVPHISNVDDARSAANLSLYQDGARGFSAAHRAGHYGTIDIDEYINAADATTIIIAQIEDTNALEHLSEIFSEDRIDCFFIGKADLMVSMRETSMSAPALDSAIDRIVRSAQEHKRPLGAYLGCGRDTAELRAQGFSLLALDSDHGHLQHSINNHIIKQTY